LSGSAKDHQRKQDQEDSMPTKTASVIDGPKIKTAMPGPNGKRVLAGDERYISPSYTRSYPLVAKEGR
jgi:4-aminobutyrate aminotransferase